MMTDTPDAPKGYHHATSDEIVALRHFAETHKALHALVGLFIVGPFKKDGSRPEVKAAIAALAQTAGTRKELGLAPPIPNVLGR